MIRTILISTLLSSLAGCCCSGPLAIPDDKEVTPGHAGQFDADTASVTLLADGRNVVLVKALKFTDVRNVVWIAPKDEKSDGASIPEVFWSIIGGPFEGQYRFAALVHDHYCDSHDGRRWQDVHRMFYEASIAGGTPELLAKILYAAVYHFGPRWSDEDRGYEQLQLIIPTEAKRIADLTAVAALKDQAATKPSTIGPRISVPTPKDRASFVLQAGPKPLAVGVPNANAAVVKWDKILAELREHPEMSLADIQAIK